MSQSPQLETARSQLRRLGTLTDVVYAVALVLIIQWLPLPEESSREGSIWIGDLWVEFGANLLSVFIGVVFVIIYWLRSNKLMSALDHTDGVHTAFSIASVFFLLLLLIALSLLRHDYFPYTLFQQCLVILMPEAFIKAPAFYREQGGKTLCQRLYNLRVTLMIHD